GIQKAASIAARSGPPPGTLGSVGAPPRCPFRDPWPEDLKRGSGVPGASAGPARIARWAILSTTRFHSIVSLHHGKLLGSLGAPHLLIRGKVGSRDALAGGGNRVPPVDGSTLLFGVQRGRQPDGLDVPSRGPARRHRRPVRRASHRARPERLYPDDHTGKGRDARPRPATSAAAVRQDAGEPHPAPRHRPRDH